MQERCFFDKIDEYVRCFDGVGPFFKKILDSFDFDFSIINVDNSEVDISNKAGFFSGVKCYNLYYGRNEKCEKCLIDEVVEKKSKISIEKNEKDIFLYPIFNGGGEVVRVIKYDLEKKEMIKKVIVNEESNEFFYNILQNSQDVVYCFDFIKGKFKYVSESVFTLFGFPLSEFVNMSYADFLERIHPDDSKEDYLLEDVKGLEHIREKKYRWLCKDGKYRWFFDKMTWFFDEKGNRVAIVGNIKNITEERLENERLEVKISKMKEKEGRGSKRSTLTDREKIVLWGLCRWPLLNDEELSGKLKLKRSTLTAIKNRLRKGGWFSLKYIPNFYKLSCEAMGFFNIAKGRNVRVDGTDFMKDSSGVVLRNIQDENIFGVFVAEKFVDFKKFCEDFCCRNEGARFSEDSFFFGLDDFELRDSSGVIDFVFNLKRKEDVSSYDFSNNGVELNSNERRVFHAMIQNPELSSSNIAKKIWISKPTVIKIKNRLLDDGIVYAYIAPDFRKLGFNFLAKISYEFDGGISKGIVKDGMDSRVLFRVAGKKRIVKFVLFESEDEYLEEIDLIREVYRRNDIYFDIKSDIFPIQKRGKGNLDLEPLVRDMVFDEV